MKLSRLPGLGSAVLALSIAWALPRAAAQGVLFLSDYSGGTVSTYTTGGTSVSSPLVSGLNQPYQIAVGPDGALYAANFGTGTVGKYNAATGAAINASLITGLSSPFGIAVDSSGTLYVGETGRGTLGSYNATTGATLNRDLVTGLAAPYGIALDGLGNVFVANSAGSVVKYILATGAAIPSATVTIPLPYWLAADGANDRLYVATPNDGRVGLYNATTGTTINSAFITSLSVPLGMALDGLGTLYVVGNGAINSFDAASGSPIALGLTAPLQGSYALAFAVPEPSSVMLLALGAAGLYLLRLRRRS